MNSWTRLIFGIALLSSVTLRAANPSPFIPVDKAWGAATFEREAGGANPEDLWRYTRTQGTLMLSKNTCTKCEAISQKLIDLYNKSEEDTAILMDHLGTPASLSFGTAPSGHQIILFEIVMPQAAYRMQLVINNKASSEQSFALQQELIRMINAFKP